jgi:Mg2+-importing ATPase
MDVQSQRRVESLNHSRRARESVLDTGQAKQTFRSTILVIAGVIVIPYTPLSGLLGLTGIPPVFFAALVGILAVYALSAELAKWLFYRSGEQRTLA